MDTTLTLRSLLRCWVPGKSLKTTDKRKLTRPYRASKSWDSDAKTEVRFKVTVK